MKTHLITIGFTLFSLSPTSLAADGENPAGRPTKLDELIEQMQSDDFDTREKSTLELWEKGSLYIDEIEQLANSDNPELIIRARSILKNIKLGIYPDTDSKITDAYKKYLAAGSPAQRQSALYKLFQVNGTQQIIMLYLLEKNPLIKKELEAYVIPSAPYAAREILRTSTPEKAISILEKLPRKDQIAQALASLYKQNGTLTRRIKQIEARGKTKSQWYFQLVLTAGDTDKAIAWAKKNRDKGALVKLQMLQGNINPLIDLLDTTKIGNTYTESSYTLAKMIHRGEFDQADEFAKQLADRFTRAKNSNLSHQQASSLMINGYSKAAIKLMKPQLNTYDHAEFTNLSLRFYTSAEQTQKLLDQLNIPHDKEGVKKWSQNHVDTHRNTIGDKQFNLTLSDNLKNIILAAQIYNYHGDKERTRMILDPFYDACAKEQQVIWRELIVTLCNNNLTWYVLDKGQKNPQSIEPIMASYLDQKQFKADKGDFFPMSKLWTDIKTSPGTIEQHFRMTLSYLGLISCTMEEIETVHKQLISMAKALPDTETYKYYNLLYKAVFFRGDTKHGYELMTILHEIASEDSVEKNKWHDGIINHHADMGNWEELIKRYDAQEFYTHTSTPAILLYLAIAFEKTGKIEKSKAIYKMVNELHLGDPYTLLQLCKIEQSNHRHARAYHFAIQAYTQSKPFQGVFYDALYTISIENKHLKEEKNWNLLHTFTSAHKFLNIKYISKDSERKFRVNTNVRSHISNHNNISLHSDFSGMMVQWEKTNQSPSNKDNLNKSLDRLSYNKSYTPSLTDVAFSSILRYNVAPDYDAFFEESYQTLNKVIEKHPTSYGTANTLAWMCAIGQRKLDRGIELAKMTIKNHPLEGNSVDTLAELHFSMGDRETAIKTSERAVEIIKRGEPGNPRLLTYAYRRVQSLKGQLEHFKNSPLPKAKPNN